ncbi:hypothetical protein [Yersinia enterocolitica]|uniref:hypothetical protein n=1 Tax=Yersinia enterocolitica TaxID=630 RepID=UPI00155A55DB|nr:hypothetical protein [Yersinia enterocolitica]EKN4067913.1 hypothetical protein [Yersinia enterocolitica]EKN4159736.1 hypothetical protein [Yersinia enterocolitica]EKN6262656.1 hypothetical protein [Yersinia enterocolitica]MBW5847706.1 hypothetical protein [Yersinia enterocolitica]MBW5865077.1 hypothetical protein [Yersinia enterocolitica]
MTNITPTTAQSVELIANIVAKKLAIDGQEARRMAITGALSGVTQAFYSRQHSPSDTKQP